ncbi:MAG: hypothetical protein N2491_01605, partial [Negativicutes bacterium]|nr:hypothetical protein [Negativicutes bacterium]
MIDSPFKIVLADLSSHTILYVDVPTGKIMSEIPYPASVRPAGAILAEDRRTAYIPAVNKSGKGILFALNLESISLYQLPVDFPSPIRFCLAPGGRHAYLADTAGALYALDLASLAVKQWGHMPEDTGCAGIAASDNSVYTVWECAEDGAIAIFNRQGELTQQIPLQGKPTYLALTPQGKLLVAHTAGKSGGEGIDIIDTARCGGLF